jgi:hypothetical protein
MNFWRQIPAGTNPPENLNMVIEVTSGSRSKFEYNTDWEAFVLPQTMWAVKKQASPEETILKADGPHRILPQKII